MFSEEELKPLRAVILDPSSSTEEFDDALRRLRQLEQASAG